MRGLVFCLLLGCASGANPETLVDELRVVAIVAEPPEAVPGEEVQITAWLADPEESGAYAGAWTCVGVGGECLEQDTERLSRTSELGSTIGWTLTAPVEAAALLGEGESAAAGSIGVGPARRCGRETACRRCWAWPLQRRDARMSVCVC